MSIDQQQLTRLDELAAAIHGKGTTIEMLNRWAAFESACKPDLIRAMVAVLVQLKAENEALREKYEILLEAASNMLPFSRPTCMNDEKWRDRVASMAKEASHG